MSLPPFQYHHEFLEYAKTTGPDQAVTILLGQLQRNLNPALLDLNLISSFPTRILQQYQIIPLFYESNTLHFASTQPQTEIVESLMQTLSCTLRPHRMPERLFAEFERLLSQLSGLTVPKPETDQPETESERTVSRVFRELLELARHLRASDIHFEPQADASVLVRFRIDGLLHDIETLRASDYEYRARLASRIKVAANLDIAETRVPQDGRITETIENEPIDLRVSTLPSMHGEKVVIRLLPHKNPFQQISDLGLEGKGLQTYYNWIKKPQGMILITGQTGSGKTSTLYTTLSEIRQSEKNIVTIEDPIEYQLSGVTQVQVHPKVGLTFSNGLRSILRQDPDVILLGEIRDAETAEIAYQAALTGHMVLSTLHTNDAPSAIIRLMDIHVEPYLIASATLGVVAQRLIRKVCPYCAQAYTPKPELLNSLGLDEGLRDLTFNRAVGCEQCFQTGYYGREGIFEVMPVDEELAGLISQKEQLGYIRSYLQQNKIQSLYDSALSKVQRGITTVEEIYRVVPPTQTRQTASGSAFILMLFLLSIFSILILNAATLFGSSGELVKMEKQAMQGKYAAGSALEIGKRDLISHLNSETLFFFEKDKLAPDPLKSVSRLSDLINRSHRVELVRDEIAANYRISLVPGKAEKQQGVMKVGYLTEILASGIIKNRERKQVAPHQKLSGHFEVQAGPLPLSFFERYSAAGSLKPKPGNGPWYSLGLPEDITTASFPQKGYYTASSVTSENPLPHLHPETALELSPNLWPLPGNPAAAPKSVLLVPLEPDRGNPYQLGLKKQDENAFNPSQLPWAITINGNVDYLELHAPHPNIQMLEFNQLLNQVSEKGGYQTLFLLKTMILEDRKLNRIEFDTRQWQLTLNPQKQVIRKRLVETAQVSFQTRFSGLILINGSVNQMAARSRNGSDAYSRPITLYALNDIGITSSLEKSARSEKAVLGIVTPGGQVSFEASQTPVIAEWNNKQADYRIEASLAAARYQVPANTSVVVNGSVATLREPFPDELETEYNPRLYSLDYYPPFFPVLNPDSSALIITRPPVLTNWKESS